MHICLDLLALCYMTCFPMLRSSFCSRLMLGLHAHMLTCLYDVVGYALLGSMCLHSCFYAYMSRSMFSHAFMLGFVFFHVFMLTSICLDVHSYDYMQISMLICVDWCVYMLRLVFSTCFMLSSMCLCTPCHVCVPTPKLCLSCHVRL